MTLAVVQFAVTNKLCRDVLQPLSCVIYYPDPVALFYGFG